MRNVRSIAITIMLCLASLAAMEAKSDPKPPTDKQQIALLKAVATSQRLNAQWDNAVRSLAPLEKAKNDAAQAVNDEVQAVKKANKVDDACDLTMVETAKEGEEVFKWRCPTPAALGAPAPPPTPTPAPKAPPLDVPKPEAPPEAPKQ